MLSVKEAARQLGVSEQRVRKMLADGQLDGAKHGKSWFVSEQSVVLRKQSGARPGRPAQRPEPFSRDLPDVEAAHRLFDEAQKVLCGCYDAAFLDMARNPQEQEFWIRTADLFLQQRQRELIAQGVF